jgi:type I restriction enzyme S subunit
VTPSINGANLAEPDDILICVRNGSKSLIGKNALIPEGMPRCTHGAFMTVLRAQAPRFVFQLLQTKSYYQQVAGDLGATINSINGSQLLKYRFIVPSPAEQQKIADCLSPLDDLIAAERRKLESLRAYKKGLMQQLFPRDGETTPRLRFPEFRGKGEWRLKKLGAVLQETPRPIEMDDDEEYSLVTVKRRYGGVVARETLNGSSIKVKSQFIVEANDFLISKRQIVHNACGLVPLELEGSIVSNEYSVLTPKDGHDIEFFSYFSQQPCVSDSFLQSSVGIVIEKMLFRLDAWLKLEFLFPGIEEQRRIASCLKVIESQITAQSEKTRLAAGAQEGTDAAAIPVGGGG